MNLILNKQLTKKNFDKIFNYIFEKYNTTETIQMLESLKLLGAIFSTKAGLSLSLNDLRIINKDKKIKYLLDIIKNLKSDEIQKDVYNVQKVNALWNNTNNLLKSYILSYLKVNDPNNQLLIVLESGARGSKEQIHQLIGLRSLMVDQSGTVVPHPIKNSFVDGVSIFEYLLSSFGARKGIIDTALKTADSGYLTRRLIESSYEIKIVSNKCKNKQTFSYKKNLVTLQKRLIILKNSVLSCYFSNNLCQNCFGLDNSTRHLVSLGENIGILSAHSISEPSTQLTMRTFHTGGVFTKQQTEDIVSKLSGFLRVYKKQQKVQLINWRNYQEEFPVSKIRLSNKFFNKNKMILNNKQIKTDILPVYICILSKNINKINLLRHNGQVFSEVYRLHNRKVIIYKCYQVKNKYNIISYFILNLLFHIRYKIFLNYIYNKLIIYNINEFKLKICL